ncbi:hypothetical protein NX801_23100 [Streptomyces sp. LP05-1]|uniref:Integral membrane protein n=1 Tax=Streptomyces pyxinae TaxID=2970734 RepID=A0ABT2CN22_9ACTN|nr:hypothetical protein [Streptomyces sp. LP05-1]MCS0638492.1 hypothetical protein [Streptomyces sp. LP05-1]
MTATRPAPVRFLRAALGSVLARLYLAVCAGLLVWALVVSSLDQPDASFAGVVPLFATAPVSLIVIRLPDHVLSIVLAVALGALVNAVLIGWCARTLRRGLDDSRGSGHRP